MTYHADVTEPDPYLSITAKYLSEPNGAWRVLMGPVIHGLGIHALACILLQGGSSRE